MGEGQTTNCYAAGKRIGFSFSTLLFTTIIFLLFPFAEGIVGYITALLTTIGIILIGKGLKGVLS